jgi:large subunit ribosomal protein L6
MSRVGKHLVDIPAGIECVIDGNILKFKKGTIEETYSVPSCIKFERIENSLKFKPLNEEQQTIALWGTSRRNVFNIVQGLDKGFRIEMEMVGVGYKAAVDLKERRITFQLGYSHDIVYNIPEDISVECPKPTSIIIKGHSKKKVGDVAALFRSYRKPEPYKGKGVMKVGEFIYRKEGKKK